MHVWMPVSLISLFRLVCRHALVASQDNVKIDSILILSLNRIRQRLGRLLRPLASQFFSLNLV